MKRAVAIRCDVVQMGAGIRDASRRYARRFAGTVQVCAIEISCRRVARRGKEIEKARFFVDAFEIERVKIAMRDCRYFSFARHPVSVPPSAAFAPPQEIP